MSKEQDLLMLSNQLCGLDAEYMSASNDYHYFSNKLADFIENKNKAQAEYNYFVALKDGYVNNFNDFIKPLTCEGVYAERIEGTHQAYLNDVKTWLTKIETRLADLTLVEGQIRQRADDANSRLSSISAQQENVLDQIRTTKNLED